jgi:hypothetical protein
MRTKDTGVITGDDTWSGTYSWQTPKTGTFKATSERRFMNGVNIPNFNRRKQNGELLPHTHFNQTEWTGRHLGGSYYGKDGANTSDISNWPGPTTFSTSYQIGQFADYEFIPTSPPATSVPEYFLQQAASRIYSSGWDALTATAEAKKTVDGFRGVSQRIVQLVRKYSTKRLLKLWLEGRYQVRTLAYDVRDLFDAVYEFDALREIYSERAGTSTSVSNSEIVSTASGGVFTFYLTRTETKTWSLRGSVAGRISPARAITNPAITAWELVPLSFVVDQVIDVGTWLEALMFQALASEWTASTGWRCEASVQFDVSAIPKPGKSGSASASWIYEGTQDSRTPKSLNFTHPKLKPTLVDPLFVLDLQALVRTRRGMT